MARDDRVPCVSDVRHRRPSIATRRTRPRARRAHGRGARPPRARRGRRRRVRPLRARTSAAAGDRPRDGLPAGVERAGGTSIASSTASSTSSRRCARSSGEGPRCSQAPATLPCFPTSTRSTARRSRARCTACSRSRSGTRRASDSSLHATGSARSRSSGHSSPDGTLAFASELKALVRLPGSQARGRPCRDRRLPGAPVRPRSRNGAPRRQQAAARPRAHL